MYVGQLVLSQPMALLPLDALQRCVKRYQGHRYVKSFSCLDQFLVMAFAQLTFRLRDIESCLRAVRSKLYRLWIGGVLQAGRCQRNPRLAHLCRLRSSADWHGQQALRAGQLRTGIGFCFLETIYRRLSLREDLFTTRSRLT